MTARRFAGPILLLALLVATRWPLAPKHLYFFDSANFALALDEFNPSLHQPQPPGYPLFVGFTRLIHLLVPDAQRVFLIAGLLAAWAALLLARTLGTRMFGPAAGSIAAALLFANPPFWLGGITNEIRVFLAAGSLGTALLSWRALEPGAHPLWFYACFLWLGIAAGFRPVESMLLFPLLFWVWARSGHSSRRLALALLVFLATITPSIAVTVAAMGGVQKTLGDIWGYADSQFRGSSSLFGARESAALKMVAEAVVWNGLGTLAWIWALRLRRVREAFSGWRVRTTFLLIWFLPPFLFSAFIHIGDPDQALTSIPALCVCGGAVLATLVEKRARRLWAIAAGAAAVCALLFFVPLPGKLPRASSYRAVAGMGRITDAAIAAVREIRGRGPAAIIHYGFPVSYRQISYYFPDDYLVVLPGTPGDRASAGEAWTIFHRKVISAYPNGAAVVLPAAARVLFLLPQGVHPLSLAPELPTPKQRGRIFYISSSPGRDFRLGSYLLTPSADPN